MLKRKYIKDCLKAKRSCLSSYTLDNKNGNFSINGEREGDRKTEIEIDREKEYGQNMWMVKDRSAFIRKIN